MKSYVLFSGKNEQYLSFDFVKNLSLKPYS